MKSNGNGRKKNKKTNTCRKEEKMVGKKETETATDPSLRILDKLFMETSAEEVLKLGPRDELLGMTPLAMAASVGNTEAVTKLLDAKADVNEKSKNNTTALMQVTHSQNIEIAQLLLQHGARLTDFNKQGDNAFMMAICSGDCKLVNVMWPYRQDLDINHENEIGNTALHLAVMKKKENAIPFLLANGADTNRQNKAGHTPLVTAIICGNLKIVEQLINHADTDLLIEGSDGNTALCQAILHEKCKAAELICQKLSDKDQMVYVRNLVNKLIKPPVDSEKIISYCEETLYPKFLTISKYEGFRTALFDCCALGHVIHMAAKNITCSSIVTASCYMCTVFMFRYSSGKDDRFVNQFLEFKGPQFILHVLKTYDNIENGLNPESEIMTSCILAYMPVSETEEGKEWMKENSEKLSQYIVMVKGINIVNKFTFVDEECRSKLKIAWKDFMKLHESHLESHREKKLTELLEEVEREKMMKDKKKGKRKTRRRKQNNKQPNSPKENNCEGTQLFKNRDGNANANSPIYNENNHSKPNQSDSKLSAHDKGRPSYDNLDGKSFEEGSLEFGFDLDISSITKSEEEWVTVNTKKPTLKSSGKSQVQTQASTVSHEESANLQQHRSRSNSESKVKDTNISWADVARRTCSTPEKQTITQVRTPPRCQPSPQNMSIMEKCYSPLAKQEFASPQPSCTENKQYRQQFPCLNEQPEQFESIWGPCDIKQQSETQVSQHSTWDSPTTPQHQQNGGRHLSARPPPGFIEVPTENWWEKLGSLNLSPFSQILHTANNVPIHETNNTLINMKHPNQFMASFIEEQQRMLSAVPTDPVVTTGRFNGQNSHQDHFTPNINTLKSSSNQVSQQPQIVSGEFSSSRTLGQQSSFRNIGQCNLFGLSNPVDASTLPQPKQLWPDHKNDFEGYFHSMWNNDAILSSSIKHTLRGPKPGQIPSDTVLYPSQLRGDDTGDPETSSDYSTQSSETMDCFPSFHDNNDIMSTSFLLEELAKEQVKQQDKKLLEHPIFENSPYHTNTDYYKSIYGIMSNTDKEKYTEEDTSPLPEWALEPINLQYEISSVSTVDLLMNVDGFKDAEEGMSRRWRHKLEEIRKLPETLKRRIGSSITIPLQSASYNISPHNNSVILGHLDDGTEVAVKVIDPKLYKINTDLINKLNSSDIKHHFLLKYLEMGETTNKKYIASELCDYTLEEYIHIVSLSHNRDALSANKLSWQLMKGLHYLHTEFNIPHGNLKPQNIYVDFEGKLKIGGYGVSKNHRLCRMSTAPTKETKHEMWRASECLGDSEDTITSTVSDVQVTGMLIYYILTGGKHPYGENPYEIEVNICQNWGQVEFISEEANDLISAMLFSDMSSRPTIDQCLGHPFFWSDEKKFRLVLIAGSDVLKEMKTGVPVTGNGATTMIDFLNVIPTETVSQDWMADLDPVVLKDMRSFRQYKNSLSELVLFLYNCCLHFEKMSPAAREVMDDPCKYFPSKFPNLFMAVYRAIKVSDRTCRTCYKPFYSHCC